MIYKDEDRPQGPRCAGSYRDLTGSRQQTVQVPGGLPNRFPRCPLLLPAAPGCALRRLISLPGPSAPSDSEFLNSISAPLWRRPNLDYAVSEA